MRVITLREPWASLVLYGIKSIETRSWYTSYRGELFIHAGKHPVPKKDNLLNFVTELLPNTDYFYGKIILKCVLEDCIQIDETFVQNVKQLDPLNYICGDFSSGRYAWMLNDIKAIFPITAIGHQGIWKYNERKGE